MKNKVFEFVLKKLIDYEISNSFEPNQYKYFKNHEVINEWCKNNKICFKTNHIEKEYFCKINEQKNNIIESYAGWQNEKINDYLRKKIEFKEVPFYITNSIEIITDILKTSVINKNLIVFRRFKKCFFDNVLRKNNVYIDKGFLSTSLNLSYRLDINCEYQRINNEVVLILKVPKGTEATYIENASKKEEYELLIQRNQKIKILKSIKLFSNRIVFAEIIH